MNDTDCRKCKSPMPVVVPGQKWPFVGRTFTLTGYRCEQCGHWNDLMRRKANKREAGES